jgi:hypothetical protein
VASAQDGAILISSGAIAARVGGAFTLEDLGLRSFENVGDAVPVYTRAELQRLGSGITVARPVGAARSLRTSK